VIAKLEEWKKEKYDWNLCCEALEQTAMNVDNAVEYY